MAYDTTTELFLTAGDSRFSDLMISYYLRNLTKMLGRPLLQRLNSRDVLLSETYARLDSVLLDENRHFM
jgi:hypothetical protein